ncbi:GSCFA domain-containing protein [Flavobacterium sp. NST-5]|uniref:GSCFA domain-containing protein n=1 Tax=Flavobacterium ichthyis TaxID=2698827 RepID=A0ABW9Z9B9_9FLAO|nr:GSCFA domain-containing protein [Flavobacterium ichthyis]NBL64384.1 GSCFA domain-containing protein [Flavobacterium ichthyis]
MHFSTPIPILKSQFPIDYSSKILMLGSCFAENISDKFSYYQFQNTVNPFGILFHPVALENVIHRAVNDLEFTENDIFFHNERWHCFEVHSEMSQPDKISFLTKLNSNLFLLKKAIQEASYIVITLGTAWIYRNLTSGNIVANCHKIPQKEFEKELLSIESIQLKIKSMIFKISKINPSAKIIFTISPVRHTKDGFVENQRSKAHLITALHAVISVPSSGVRVFYFPSYEIMMDELRDYRFYAEDMIHPNKIAVNYIWQKFCESWMTTETIATMQEVDSIQKGLSHRAFNVQSVSHQKFLENLDNRVQLLQKVYPWMQF